MLRDTPFLYLCIALRDFVFNTRTVEEAKLPITEDGLWPVEFNTQKIAKYIRSKGLPGILPSASSGRTFSQFYSEGIFVRTSEEKSYIVRVSYKALVQKIAYLLHEEAKRLRSTDIQRVSGILPTHKKIVVEEKYFLDNESVSKGFFEKHKHRFAEYQICVKYYFDGEEVPSSLAEDCLEKGRATFVRK